MFAKIIIYRKNCVNFIVQSSFIASEALLLFECGIYYSLEKT